MISDYLIPIAPAVSGLIGVLIGVISNHYFNSKRDNENEKRKIRVLYLFDTYRKLEMQLNREIGREEMKVAFESAIADIQLLGTKRQIDLALGYIEEQAMGCEEGIEKLLGLLRDDLRAELGLSKSTAKVVVFRFPRHETIYIGGSKK